MFWNSAMYFSVRIAWRSGLPLAATSGITQAVPRSAEQFAAATARAAFSSLSAVPGSDVRYAASDQINRFSWAVTIGCENVGSSRVALKSTFVALKYWCSCLLYTSDAADDLLCVDLGGRRII